MFPIVISALLIVQSCAYSAANFHTDSVFDSMPEMQSGSRIIAMHDNRSTLQSDLPLLSVTENSTAVKLVSQSTDITINDFYEFVENWHRNRAEILKSEHGWLRLAGLHWLEEGEQSFGSGGRARIRFPEGSIPEFAGIFKLEADTVRMQVAGKTDIRDQNGRQVKDEIIYTPELKKILRYRSLSWFVVRQEDELGIRLFDDKSPYLTHFEGIERYEVDRNWRVEAKFTPGGTGNSMKLENVNGGMDEWDVAGTITFTAGAGEAEVVAFGTGDRLFIPFMDATSGSETYVIGRYVYIDRPQPGEPAIIDFNVSYNPPCAFNPITSCPLPPQQNRIDFPIRAGEKNFEIYEPAE